MDSTPLIGITAHQALVTDADVAVLHHVANVAYAKAVRKAGGVPMLLPMLEPRDAVRYVTRVDGLLVTGGDDVNPDRYDAPMHPETKPADPARDDFEIALVRAAIDERVPMFCVCRGVQVLNVALGGTLDQHHDGHFDLARYNESAHDVRVESNSTLARIVGETTISVNSLHHQALGELAGTLRAVAHSDDGLVEGVELEGVPFALGVQWHPELLRHRPEHLALFEALVAAGTARSA